MDSDFLRRGSIGSNRKTAQDNCQQKNMDFDHFYFIEYLFLLNKLFVLKERFFIDFRNKKGLLFFAARIFVIETRQFRNSRGIFLEKNRG
jgi:hypothetical protein